MWINASCWANAFGYKNSSSTDEPDLTPHSIPTKPQQNNSSIPVGEKVGPYLIGAHIGSGRYSVVHEARHSQTGQQFVIKFNDTGSGKIGSLHHREALEAHNTQLAASKLLDHPGIEKCLIAENSVRFIIWLWSR